VFRGTVPTPSESNDILTDINCFKAAVPLPSCLANEKGLEGKVTFNVHGGFHSESWSSRSSFGQQTPREDCRLTMCYPSLL
jgi:hypothetical protein